MKTFFIVLTFAFVVIISALILFLGNLNLSANAIKENNEYSWTRAICNDKNECIDVIIYCKDGKIIDLKPVLYKVKHLENWTDFRANETSKFC